jgi:uncharacterized protein YbjT (DUF2867 family)
MTDDNGQFPVLVIGGYGFFGQRLANRLARIRGVHLVLAGRNIAKANAMAVVAVGLLELDDILAEAEGLAIQTVRP